MEVGDLVRVKTKLYGKKHGVIVKLGMDGLFIQPTDHPRMIVAKAEDVEVIEKGREYSEEDEQESENED